MFANADLSVPLDTVAVMTGATRSLDPLIALATSVHAQPGVYALLLGSGVSTASGIPTGWGVIRQLVVRASVVSQEPLDGDVSDEVLEAWWLKHGDGEALGYSALLEQLAPTPASRRALLAGFFEPSDDDRDAGLKVPGAAHHAVADLVARGSIRVVLTTNFDRLTEQALEAKGIFPQVLIGENSIAGMEPLAHARCTIVKLHGDYASLDQRNTDQELSEYGPRQTALLERVIDEYGLIVSGWSADWDRALVATIERSPTRRYPTFWAQVGPLGSAGARLVGQRGASLLEGAPAGELFDGLVHQLAALDDLTRPALTTAMAIARMKRALPDPRFHIELRDLFDTELARLGGVLAERASLPPASDPAAMYQAHQDLRVVVDPLLHMFAQAVSLDRDRAHTALWTRVIERAMRVRQNPAGPVQQWWDDLQHFPALLLLRAGLMGAVVAGHEDVAVALLRDATWRDSLRERAEMPAFVVLNEFRVLHEAVINGLAAPHGPATGTRWIYPISHFLTDELRHVGTPLAGDDDSYVQLAHDVEYRLAIADQTLPNGGRWVALGEFVGETGWDFQGVPWVEQRFRQHADPEPWGWHAFNDDGPADVALIALREKLRAQRRPIF